MISTDNTLEKAMKPVGDLHSVPHFRCPVCRGAVVVFRMDKRVKRCRWCGQKLKWTVWQRGRSTVSALLRFMGYALGSREDRHKQGGIMRIEEKGAVL